LVRRWSMAGPWTPSCRLQGVSSPLGSVWWSWRRGHFPWPPLAAVVVWTVPWDLSGHRGCVADILGPVLWGRCLSPWPHLATVGAWPVSWDSSGRREGWPISWAPSGRPGDVAGHIGAIWPPWGVAGPRSLSGRFGGVADPLGPVWPPWGCGPFPVTRVATVGAWLVDLAPSGHCGGIAGPLGPLWPSWGVAGPLDPSDRLGRGRSY